MTAKVLRGSFGAIQEQSIQAKETRPRQEELAGKANQDPGKRSLPGRPLKAFQETCRDAPRVPTRPGERQAPEHDKTTTAARSLPRETPASCPRSSPPANVSLWNPPKHTQQGAVQLGVRGGKQALTR